MGCPTSKKGAKETGASRSSGVLVSSLLCVQTLDLFFSVSLVLISRVDPATVCPSFISPPCPLFNRRGKCVREGDVDISKGNRTRTCLEERRARQGDQKKQLLGDTSQTLHLQGHLIKETGTSPRLLAWRNPQNQRGFFSEREKERERSNVPVLQDVHHISLCCSLFCSCHPASPGRS